MPFYTDNSDLRPIKTKKLIKSALLSLLEHTSFKKITVKEICGEALISRVTFYAHYTDKYDLLCSLLASFRNVNIPTHEAYPEAEKTINCLIRKNEAAIKNVLCNADDETLEILFNFIITLLSADGDKLESRKHDTKYIVLSNFFAGGMLRHIMWHVKNKFPSDIMNSDLFDLIKTLKEWETQ